MAFSPSVRREAVWNHGERWLTHIAGRHTETRVSGSSLAYVYPQKDVNTHPIRYTTYTHAPVRHSSVLLQVTKHTHLSSAAVVPTLLLLMGPLGLWEVFIHMSSAWAPDPKTMNIGRWPHVQFACLVWAVTTCELHLGFSGLLPAWALAQPKRLP